MQILIVDNEVNVARLLADSVRRQGHQAIVASKGEEGLALIALKRPDAVFLDVDMPGLNGIDVLRRIRKTDTTLPVIILSGTVSPSQINEAKLLGVTDIIRKPFALTHLNRALKRSQFKRGCSQSSASISAAPDFCKVRGVSPSRSSW
jgi:DNA-binding response OmpR family regulator